MEWEKRVSDRGVRRRNQMIEWMRLGLMFCPSGFLALWLMGFKFAPTGGMERMLVDGLLPGLLVVCLGAAVCDGWISGDQGRGMGWPGVGMRAIRFLVYQLVVLPMIGGIMLVVVGVGFV